MPRPRLADGESVPLTVRIPAGLDKAVRDFCRETGLSRSSGIRELLERGLNADVRPRKAARAREAPAAGKVGCRHPVGRRIGRGAGARCGECGEPVK